MGDLTKNLSRHEFACKCGCGFDTVDFDLANILQETVDHFWAAAHHDVYSRASIIIISGCRCPTHNKKEGGSKRSRHMKGNAADFKIILRSRNGKKVQVPPEKVCEYLDNRFPNKYGIGWYNSWTHFDTSSSGKRRWDMR